MTVIEPEVRFIEHRRAGLKFGITVADELLMPVMTDDVAFRETVLCNFCADESTEICGSEWFMFNIPTPAIALRIGDFMAKIKANEFEGKTDRRAYLIDDRRERMICGMSLIRGGASVVDVARRLGVTEAKILRNKEYKGWVKTNSELSK